MNAEQERLIRSWLDARDPGDAPARLRAAAADVPYRSRRSIFPAFDAAMARILPTWAVARPVLLLIVGLSLAAAIVGAALVLRSQPLPPRGLIAYTAPLGPAGATGIRLVAADGSGGRQITAAVSNIFEHAPRWSADGRTLLFARTTDLDPLAACGGVGSIVLYDMATGTERVVASGLRPLQQVEWSPSGDRVAFVHPPAGCGIPAELGVVDLASGRISTSPLQESGIAWKLRWVAGVPSASAVDLFTGDVPSQDGRFKADCGGLRRDPTHRLQVSDRQTGTDVDLGPGLAGAWSPDDTALAFIQPASPVAYGDLAFQDRLAIAVVGTWEVRILSDIETTQLAVPTLRWTADGAAIYWIDSRGGHVVDVASGHAADLPAKVNGSADLQWQPVPG